MKRAQNPSSTEPPRDLDVALVLHPAVGPGPHPDAEARLAEAVGLAEALDLSTAHAAITPLRRVQARAYFGEGKVEEIAQEAAARGAGVVIIDTALSPVQQRNLETALNAKVVDRTGLILEIFGRRAATREGRLQVELARLGYERSRLVRTWTHLERQRGGLGKTGGPGETQIELDRRLIADRIVKLKRELNEVRRTRGLQRRARARSGLPAIVLVGYTNAGKSSLFNRLTGAGVLAKDMPFATLDPTARLVRLPSGRSVIMADTVGFITDLPTELIAAFRATLEAVMEADLVLHVRDIATPETDRQCADVLGILAQLREGVEGEGPPVLEVWNKIDLLGPDERSARTARAAGDEAAVMISAVTGDGVAGLLERIDQTVHGGTQIVRLRLDPADGRTRAWIASRGRIVREALTPGDMLEVEAELPTTQLDVVRRWLADEGERRAAE